MAKTTPIATNTHEEIITYFDIFNDLFICVSISGAKVQQYFDIRNRLFFFLQEKLVWRKKKGTSYIITEGEREMRKNRETQGFFVQFENKFA